MDFLPGFVFARLHRDSRPLEKDYSELVRGCQPVSRFIRLDFLYYYLVIKRTAETGF